VLILGAEPRNCGYPLLAFNCKSGSIGRWGLVAHFKERGVVLVDGVVDAPNHRLLLLTLLTLCNNTKNE